MMKKALAITGLVVAVLVLGGWFAVREEKAAPPKVPDNLIRFHVLANSDSEADQQLKLKVRDAILQKFSPILGQASSIKESRQLVDANLGAMEKEAARVIAAEGKNYPVTVVHGFFDFPVKSYGSLTLPAGRYEAVRVVIGAGKGHNWWCVLFPPLCFVDVNTEQTGVSQAEAQRLQHNEQHGIQNGAQSGDVLTDTQPVVKLKLWEDLKGLFTRFTQR